MDRSSLFIWTITASFLANGLVVLCTASKSLNSFQYFLFTLVPLRVSTPLLIVLIVVKFTLRKSIPMNKAGYEEARKISSDAEKSWVARGLARSYLIIEASMVALVGWLSGSAAFDSFAQSNFHLH